MTADESCLNGGKRFVQAESSCLDDIFFELVQRAKLFIQRTYGFWISECVAASKATAFNRSVKRWAKDDVMKR
jgi:hypothetical protein